MQQVGALAIGAHPDDVELGCGGTLLTLVTEGVRFGIVDLTRGELGSRGSAAERAREAEAAARILGAAFRVNMELTDGDIEVNSASRQELIRIIRASRPELIFTHSAGGHPDHRKTLDLVQESAHHAGLEKVDTGQPRHRPRRILRWMEFRQAELPDVFVDISKRFEGKEESIRAYRSQLFRSDADGQPETFLSRPEFLDQIKTFHRHLGTLAGCRYAEGFLLDRPLAIQLFKGVL